MDKIKLSLNLNVGYESLPIPDKIIIPIGQGKFGPLGYKQHESDPLAVEQFHIQFGDANRLKISLRLTGRIAISGILPDLKLGGLKVEVMSNLTLQNMVLRLANPVITRLELPNIPALAEGLVKDLLNKHLLKKVAEVFAVDLKTTLDKAIAQANRPSSFDFKIGKSSVAYELKTNVEYFPPQLTIAPPGLLFNVAITFAPAITPMQHPGVRGIMPARRTRRAAKQRPRKRKQ